MIALLTVASASACDSRTLLGLVRDAEESFATMDGGAFDRTALEIDRVLGCQTTAMTPIESAAFHRVQALEAFLGEDMPNTILSFQAALSVMPGYELPRTVAPDGHPLREQFEQASRMVTAGGSIDLPAPVSGWITVDGTRTRIAPASRPFVFQRLGEDGSVLQTLFVEPGDPLPTYPREQKPVAPTPVPTVRQGGVQAGWLVAGGALGLVAGGLYGGAFGTRATYDRAVVEGDEARIVASRRTTNTLVIASMGTLGVGTTFVLIGVF